MKEDLLEQMKNDRELCLSDNIEEINKRFEPCTECCECHFCTKPNYDFLPKLCILYGNKIEENQTGCYGGYKLKDSDNKWMKI